MESPEVVFFKWFFGMIGAVGVAAALGMSAVEVAKVLACR